MSAEQYRQMQKKWYHDMVGDGSTDENPNAVVGNYEHHERYPYEAYLMDELERPDTLVALDFGCGPGRMIVRMARHLDRVDGCDISEGMITAARRRVPEESRLYVTNGGELDGVPSGEYDLVYCTISFQHIASYEIRLSLLREFHRVLKPGGKISLQTALMLIPREKWIPNDTFAHVGWRESMDDAKATNGHHDCRLTTETIPLVKEDLEKIGFTNFRYLVTPPPHAYDADWIYLYATKV